MNSSRFSPRPQTQRSSRSYKNALREPSKKEPSNLRKHRPDYMILVYMSILLAVGAVTVYAISPGITSGKNLSEHYFSIKQLTAIGLGGVTFIIASLIDIKTWKKLEIPLIILAVIVASAVRLAGEEVNGAYRWLQVGGLSFQAAELIKFTLVIWLSGFLARVRIENKTNNNNVLKVLGVIIVIIGAVVAGLQSDLGSAAVMMAIVGIMAFVAGLPLKKLLIIISIVILLATVAITSSPYRRDRVVTFMNPTADCQNEGYQACQALITVGSGGLFGKGLGRSVQAYGYLPEAANDSIFAIVSEKFGFIGSTIILGVFVGLFRRIKNVAQNAPNDYSRLLVSGILAWLSIQMMINVGAMIGLIPLKGITLPFVSYGGTSIIFVMAAVGIVFHISRYTDLTRGSAQKQRKYGDNNLKSPSKPSPTRFSSARLR